MLWNFIHNHRFKQHVDVPDTKRHYFSWQRASGEWGFRAAAGRDHFHWTQGSHASEDFEYTVAHKSHGLTGMATIKCYYSDKMHKCKYEKKPNSPFVFHKYIQHAEFDRILIWMK